MSWVRQSPGVYKHSQTGEVRRSATKPTDGGGGGSSGGAMNPQLQAAQANLAQQVASGGITQAQADAELNRLQSTGYGAAPNISLSNPGEVFNAQQGYGAQQTQQGNLLTNPNQFNPFGSQTVTIDPATGQPSVSQNLSQGQQGVVGGLEGSATGASDALQRLLAGMYGQGQSQTSEYEDSIFKRLTQDAEQNKTKEMEQLSQTLANRGIPMGSELYNNQMEELNKRYDNLTTNARQQATETGMNYGLQSIPALSGVGQSGFLSPQYNPFQSQQFNQVNFQDLFNQMLSSQTATNVANIGKRPSGGGGGGAPTPSSPFNNSVYQ